MPEDLEALSQRVHRLEDRTEISELVARYAVAVDDGDFPTLGRLFAEHSEFEGLVGPTSVGRQQVVDYLKGRSENPRTRRLHTPTAHYLEELTSDTATGVVLCYAGLFDESGSLSFFGFRYDDRYVREDGGWKFARRHVHRITNLIPAEVPSH